MKPTWHFRLGACVLFLMVIAAFTGSAFAATVTLPTNLGPITLPTENFPNVVLGGSFSSTSLTFGAGLPVVMGPFTIAQVTPFVVGADISKGLGLDGGTGGVRDYLIPGFGDISIVNGTGYDLIVWEAGIPAEQFRLAVSTDGGVSFTSDITYDTHQAVPYDASSGYATNTGWVNLDDFSVGPGDKIDALRIDGLYTGIGGSGPDILAIGVINAGAPTGNVPGTIPEPGTLLLLGTGLVGLARFVRRKISA